MICRKQVLFLHLITVALLLGCKANKRDENNGKSIVGSTMDTTNERDTIGVVQSNWKSEETGGRITKRFPQNPLSNKIQDLFNTLCKLFSFHCEKTGKKVVPEENIYGSGIPDMAVTNGQIDLPRSENEPSGLIKSQPEFLPFHMRPSNQYFSRLPDVREILLKMIEEEEQQNNKNE